MGLTANTRSLIDKAGLYRGGRLGKLSTRALLYVVLTASSILMIVPFVWMLSTSLKPDYQIFEFPPSWIPRELNWGNYVDAWQKARFSRYALNTAVYAVFSTLGQVTLCSMAGYSFARLRFPGQNALFVLVLATMMIPFQMLLIPLFVILKRWPLAGGNNIFGSGGTGLIDTLVGLTLPNTISAFGIFLIRQFSLTLPGELADAARMDGCSEATIFWRIMMPLMKPALTTLAIFAFQDSWNDFTWPLVITMTEKTRTLQLGLQTFQNQFFTEWGLLMAGTTITVFPLVVLFIIGQRYFVQGIALTGTKG
ncbi:MAG: carbohydrate ABC transporter permease [Anaerolineae bacterium]|nr:carbohydrate ABC transporter permease [Anaerolineae bacterium]